VDAATRAAFTKAYVTKCSATLMQHRCYPDPQRPLLAGLDTGLFLQRICSTISGMKSAILPQVRVDPELRADLESMLRKGETLSEFIEDTVRSAVAYRRTQAEFHARGETAWQEYLHTGVAHPVDTVIAEMRERLEIKRRQLAAAPAKAR